MGIETIIAMIPKGGRYAKSVVNFVHKVPQNWEKFKSAIQQIENILKQGKLRLDGKQQTIFETNKNILKNHETVTKKKVELPPVKKEDAFKGFTPSLVERSKARAIYTEMVPTASKYTKEMEKIDEELDALAFGGDKYRTWSEGEKAKLFKKLQADMKKLIDGIKKDDLTTLSLSQLNKKSQNLQKRIREISENPDIKGTVTEGPKADMIKALYDSENVALTNARKVITKKNSELKYGNKYPVLDPENNAFVIVGLDKSGNPMKMSRFTGKFSASPDKATGKWSKSGTSFYDKWNAETNQFRKEGEEIFKNTIKEGKEIVSNPEYKLPKIENMEIWNEIYSEKSISDLAKKGHTLKDIDMLMKGKEVNKYLKAQEKAEKGLSTYEKMHERTSTTAVGEVMEDLYFRGDDIYKMTMKEWITKIPEYFAEGGRTGFHRGSLRHQKEHDYRAYEKSGDRLKQSSPENVINRLFNLSLDEPARDDFETWQKERFMYGEHKPTSNFEQIWEDIKKLLDKKRNEHATGGVSNLFRERQGYRSGKAVELVTKLPEFLKFVELLLIKASNQIRRGLGKWKGLDIKQKTVQHDNLTKMVTEFQKTKKFDPKMNEYFGIDAEKAFIEAQAKVKKTVPEVKEKSIFSMTKEEKAARLKKYQEETGIQLSYGNKDAAAAAGAAADEGIQLAILKGNFERKYTGVIDDRLMKQVLADNDPQRISEVMATIDQSVIMQKKGMKTSDIMETLKESFTRKKQATGGLIPGYATGGVSNLFRSR